MVSIGPHHPGCGYPQCVCCCRNLWAMDARAARADGWDAALDAVVRVVTDHWHPTGPMTLAVQRRIEALRGKGATR